MRIVNVEVQNFRGHECTSVPLTQLGCLIGENNAGKSSILHAIQFALEERKVDDQDFRNPEAPVVVTLRIEDIGESDLGRVGESHRQNVSQMLSGGALTIVRSQHRGGKAESKFLKPLPRDESRSWELFSEASKGKTGKPLREFAIQAWPEIDSLLGSSPKKSEVQDAWGRLVAELDPDQLEYRPVAYPTGIAAAVKPLFPSIIYIESVKDASVEAKSTGASAFAKLLGMLFEEVEDQFRDIEEQFASVHRKLSRHLGGDGVVADGRLEAVQAIESVIENNVTASFPGVKVHMNIPAPTLPMLLSNADLLIDDGHIGQVASKGDGLKRSVLFALLRSYAEMRNIGLDVERASTGADETDRQDRKRPYFLLFEEPELYLHPRAQRQLMAALEQFSHEHQVLVTTHSAGFFRPRTQGFTRLFKTEDGVEARPVNLTSMSLRDAYQVVRHENNEAAFFAKRVVLVEGDSDTFLFPHLARLISEDWDDVERNIMFLKIGGKGNVGRYREFFEHFGVPVKVIVDLDAISSGFEQLADGEQLRLSRGKLMALVDQHLNDPSEPKGGKIKKLAQSGGPQQIWRSAQANFATWCKDRSESAALAVDQDLKRLFDLGHGGARLDLLKSPPDDSIRESLDDLIKDLAESGVFVLRRGDLESYCGTTATGNKVERAIQFSTEVDSLQKFSAVHADDADSVIRELSQIFSMIYE